MTIRNLALTRTGTTEVLHDADDVTLQMDEEAFHGFYDRTARMLWVYLHRLTGDRHAADDLLQEAYYRFLRSEAPLGTETHRRHYLFRIATNLARDRGRRRRSRPAHVEHDDTTTAREGASPGASALDVRLDLARAFSRLRHRERALLWLAHAYGSSHEEIARIVGVRTSSVKPLLVRARRRLAAFLGRKDGTR